MAYDCIAHSERIEEHLKQVGLVEEAERLTEARLAGATSGEILMSLRFVARELIFSGALNDSIKEDAYDLIAAINKSGV